MSCEELCVVIDHGSVKFFAFECTLDVEVGEVFAVLAEGDTRDWLEGTLGRVSVTGEEKSRKEADEPL